MTEPRRESESATPFERLEAEAIDRAISADDRKERSEWLEIAKSIQERKRLSLDIDKLSLECDTARLENKFGRTRFIATILTPILAVITTAAAIVFQAYQFRINSRFQSEQLKTTTELEVAKDEDEKWRELMKAVSFNDSKSALVGALAVEGFFSSKYYSRESRSIATALLPLVDDVSGFDYVLDELALRTSATNQYELVSISSMIAFRAKQQHHLDAGAAINDHHEVPAFLQHDVSSIDPNPDTRRLNQAMRDKISA